jgi:outer membrane protein assembly factor BamA
MGLRAHRLTLRACPLAILLAACAGTACGASTDSAVDGLERQTEQASSGRDPGTVILPIPQSNPTVGTGLALAGLLLYDPSPGGRPWMTGLGGLYTDSESWAAGLMQKAYLYDDRLRLTGVGGYGNFNIDFYGVGNDAGDQDRSIPLNQKGAFLVLKALGEVAPGMYLGAQYRWLKIESTFDPGALGTTGIALPPLSGEAILSGLGLLAEYDTRDNELNPRQGAYLSLSSNFSSTALGSDFDYRTAYLAYNRYMPAGPSGVLALRASACAAGGDVPFYELCLFGAHNDLRGYPAGRYRDNTLLTMQGEYRWRFHPRWGLVGFAGVGEVADAFSDFDADHVLPSVGAGLRFLASKEYHVNVSMDYALGEDSRAFYFYIAEAF